MKKILEKAREISPEPQKKEDVKIPEEKELNLKDYSFTYETITAAELTDNVFNLGDSLIIIPPTCPPLIKIRISKK